MKNKKIIAIIPARGGSKGIPKKNIKILAGKPLIAYTIEQALKSKFLNRVIVSTDDKEIAEISKKYGAEIIKRPENLATDRAKITDVIFHLLGVLKKEKYIPEIIVSLQPTSPLRTVNDIDRAIEIFLKNKCKSVISVCESGHSFYWSFKIEKKYLKPIFEWRRLNQQKQDLPKVYIPNGAIYISTPKSLFKYRSFYCRKILPYPMREERSVDIDNEVDFKLAEILMKNYK